MGGGMRRGMGGMGMHTKKKDSLISHVAAASSGSGSSGMGGAVVEEEEDDVASSDVDTDEEIARHVPLSAAYDTDSDDDDSYLHKLGVTSAPQKATSSLHPHLSAHHEKAKFSSKIRGNVDDDDEHLVDVRAHLKDHNKKKAPADSHAHADQYKSHTFTLPSSLSDFEEWAAVTSKTAQGGVLCIMAALRGLRHKRFDPRGRTSADSCAVAECLHQSVLKSYHGSAGSSTGGMLGIGGPKDSDMTTGDVEALLAMTKKPNDVTEAYMRCKGGDTFTCEMFARVHADAELNQTMTVMIKDGHSKYPRSVKLRCNGITQQWKLVHWRNLLR
jgi:hypothetical protein